MSADPVRDLIDLAAFGDRDAQVALSTYSLITNASEGTPEIEAVVAAEAFAHLAAAHGGVNETLHLANILVTKSAVLDRLGDKARSRRTRSDADDLFDWVAEAGAPEDKQALAALLEGYADDGDDDAAIRLNRFLASLTRSEAAKISSGAKRQRKESNKFAAEVAGIINQRTA